MLIWRRIMKIPWTQHASKWSNEQRDDGWKSFLARNFEKTAEKLHCACLKTRFLITEGHRRKVSVKEKPRKTKSNVIGWIDAGRWREWDWLRIAERKSTGQKNLASLSKNLPLGRKHRAGPLLLLLLLLWKCISYKSTQKNEKNTHEMNELDRSHHPLTTASIWSTLIGPGLVNLSFDLWPLNRFTGYPCDGLPSSKFWAS